MNRITLRSSWFVLGTILLLTASVMAGSGSSRKSAPHIGPQTASASPLLPPVPDQPHPSRALTFEERVAYQRRIEEVHWRHTIWPEANPRPKPALSEVMSDDAIRSKVQDALRKSSALEVYWQRPITAEQLQAEMERMARGTRHPEMLRELFAALDDDPFVIAECLARPALADRLLRNWYAYDDRFHGEVQAAAESAIAGGVTASELPAVAEEYREIVIELERDPEAGPRGGHDAAIEEFDPRDGERGVLRLDAEEWSEEVRRIASRFGAGRTALPESGQLRAVARETAGRTDDGIEILFEAIPVGEVSALEETADGWQATTVLSKPDGSMQLGIAQWPKLAFSTWWASAQGDMESATVPVMGEYTLAAVANDAGCTPDTWRISVHGPPQGRQDHAAVWTGSRMIVWGGDTYGASNTGGVYDPATDSWTPTTVEGAPTGRYFPTAVWTGDRMIVWGGGDDGGMLNSGGAYDPATNNWTPTSVEGAPSERGGHIAVWTGDRMIVWGGYDDSTTSLNTGGVYEPATDSWTPTSIEGAPSGRLLFTAVWTGNHMIVWGGREDFSGDSTNTGSVYDPATDSWTPTSVDGAPAARYGHTAVWTGDRMIVWGGMSSTSGNQNTGGVYDPATDTWTPTSVDGAPAARSWHTAVWTGDRMIVWGGLDPLLNTGGVYDLATDSWTPTSVEGAPPATALHTAVWTGDRMIVWGGAPHTDTGGLYDPMADSWTPTSDDGAPSARWDHTAVWTGNSMIVWGGGPGQTDTGGVYDLATDSWTPTSLEGAPSPRSWHTAVWTGHRMIVWGGYGGSIGNMNTGGVYDPAMDTWTPTSLEGAPSDRSRHTAVWTGDRMIVWGDWYGNAGGVYDPATDRWTPTSVEDAPSQRLYHTAVWTGDRMIVWGGGTTVNTITGGVYDPATDTWTPTSVDGAPSRRENHTAVWTGDRMIIWGGQESDALDTGGLYDPATDSWTPTSLEGAPSARWDHTAVWTGDRMIVWGGQESDALDTGGLYDPATDSWTPTSLEGAPSERSAHTAVYTGSEMLIWGGLPPSMELGAYCGPLPPPTFTSPECGTTIYIEPGDTVEFTVTAEDAPERTVTLDGSGLPSGSVMVPPLPTTGNPVSSEFIWGTNGSDANTIHDLVFTATNDVMSSARCEVTIEVGEVTLVTLVAFTATPDDGQVTLDWTTAVELDTAGFYLVRHDLHTGTIERLDDGLIPARGDVYMGADYTYVDATAINGVEYAYTLVDVDLHGVETRHPEVRAVPNPPDPPVKLLSPPYGATLRFGEVPAFDWTPRTGRRQWVVISTDPTFADRSRTVRFAAAGKAFARGAIRAGADGSFVFVPPRADLPELDAPVYWRVEQLVDRGTFVFSDTFVFRYTDR